MRTHYTLVCDICWLGVLHDNISSLRPTPTIAQIWVPTTESFVALLEFDTPVDRHWLHQQLASTVLHTDRTFDVY